MLTRRCFVVCAMALSLLSGAGAADQQPSIPPDVQKIIEKVQSKQKLTDAEQKRLKDFALSMRRQTQGTGGSLAAEGKSSGDTQEKLPCPPARATEVATVAPTVAEYTALIRSLVETYGKRLGAERAAIDVALGKAAKAGTSGIAGAYFLTGDAVRSVYVSAVAVQFHPADMQAANNLGVALDAIPDARTATQVFLYARKMLPNTALMALNLGWSYYNSGNTALAQKQFQEASRLGPGLSGPDAGLGMLASCRGDQATALLAFRKSLSKGYSGVVAMGYRKAKKSQPKSEPQDPPTPPAPDSGPVPELPASPDPATTAASAEAFEHAKQYVRRAVPAAFAKVQDATQRVAALKRRARANPDGTLDLPLVFEKQLFMYDQIVELTLNRTIELGAKAQEQAVEVYQPAAANAADSNSLDTDKIGSLQKAREPIRDALIECRRACQSNSDCEAACEAKYQPRIDELTRQIQEIEYRMCIREKGTLETMYVQSFKAWKQLSDSLRASSRDLYAFSDPVIADIWAPALNDLVQARRELEVLNVYQLVSEGGSSLANMATSLSQVKCVPPSPPKEAKAAKDPDLGKKKSDCPLTSPLKIEGGSVKIEIGCEAVKLEAGEGIRLKLERNNKGETAIWVGAGVDIATTNFDPAKGMPLGEANISIKGETGMGIRFNQSGSVIDIVQTTSVEISGTAGGFSGRAGIDSGVSLENGVNFNPGASYTTPGS